MTESLTDREVEVIREIHAGRRNREIAEALKVTPSTAKVYVWRICQKLGFHNRTEVAVWASRALGILLLSACAFGQAQIVPVLDPANPTPLVPGPVVLDIQLVNPPAPMPSALQFTLTISPGAGTITAAVAGALVGSSKQIICVTTIGQLFTCVVYGPNDALPIPAGATIAKVTLTASAGAFSVTASKPYLSDPTGAPIAVAAGPALSFAVPVSACDLNGDGVVNLADVQLVLNQALGKDAGGNVFACTTGDLTKDGICNVDDVQREVNAAVQGGVCKVGQ